MQPGGGADLERTWRDLKGSADVLRTWVREGGRYLGLCFGAYLAGSNPGFNVRPDRGDRRLTRPRKKGAGPHSNAS
ncbi:BPL-N domain-containing protein [Streptomyces sp. WAC 06783]|uniref:BPL-N domain-containing protein n=1 Tax=Streptomyces sp. WAC 06783 TaxID=2203211 RepID=UPI0037DD1CB3